MSCFTVTTFMIDVAILLGVSALVLFFVWLGDR